MLRPVKPNNLQMATSSFGHGGRRKLPFGFTEHGAIMVAKVLNSPQTVRSLKSEICDSPSSAAWPTDDNKAA